MKLSKKLREKILGQTRDLNRVNPKLKKQYFKIQSLTSQLQELEAVALNPTNINEDQINYINTIQIPSLINKLERAQLEYNREREETIQKLAEKETLKTLDKVSYLFPPLKVALKAFGVAKAGKEKLGCLPLILLMFMPLICCFILFFAFFNNLTSGTNTLNSIQTVIDNGDELGQLYELYNCVTDDSAAARTESAGQMPTCDNNGII